jgi:hypothetical protein
LEEKKMKKYFRSAYLILLGTLLALCLSSCSPSPSTQEKTNASPGEPKPVTAQTTADNGGWLSGMPETIPPFTHGIFDKQSEKIDYPTQTLFSLYYDKVTIENAREYMAKLKEKGFSVEEDNNVKPGNFIAQGLKGEGAGKIFYSFDLQADGHVDLRFKIFKE